MHYYVPLFDLNNVWWIWAGNVVCKISWPSTDIRSMWVLFWNRFLCSWFFKEMSSLIQFCNLWCRLIVCADICLCHIRLISSACYWTCSIGVSSCLQCFGRNRWFVRGRITYWTCYFVGSFGRNIGVHHGALKVIITLVFLGFRQWRCCPFNLKVLCL